MDPTTPASLHSTAPRPGWWSRNWKWFVPMGCLTFLGLIVAFVAIIFLVVFGAMKSSDVYKNAVAQARKHPAVEEALGAPLKEGIFLSGQTSVNGASGEADIAIPVSGPKGKGKIYAVATKSAGEWTYRRLVLEVASTGERIELLPSAAEVEAEP